MARRAKGEGSLIKIRNKKKGTECPIWYAQYYQDGRQIRVSTGTTIKQEALGILRRLMSDRDRGLPSLANNRKIMYGDLRAALLANYAEKGNRSLETRADGSETIVGLKQLDDFFGYGADAPGPTVANISTNTAREFARKRLGEGAGPAMVNRSLACLRRMLRLAHEDGSIQSVPKIRLLKEPPARKGFLELEKFEELVAALPTHLRPLVLFLYWCGVRLGEARAIEWTQVDLNTRLVRLEEDQTKTEEPRIVPLPSVLANLLQAQEPKVGKVFDDTNLRTEWARACATVGLGKTQDVESGNGYKWRQYTGLIVHDLRRSAVRNLINCGVPERVAMRITGHKTRAVFDRYHIVSTEDVTKAMNRLETTAASNGAMPGTSETLVKKQPRAAKRGGRNLLKAKAMGA